MKNLQNLAKKMRKKIGYRFKIEIRDFWIKSLNITFKFRVTDNVQLIKSLSLTP